MYHASWMRDYIDGRSRRKTIVRLICQRFFNVLVTIFCSGCILPETPSLGGPSFPPNTGILGGNPYQRRTVLAVYQSEKILKNKLDRCFQTSPDQKTFAMFSIHFMPFPASISSFFQDVGNELSTYSSQMTTTHWGIVAGCAVAFGFLCLKGSGINR